MRAFFILSLMALCSCGSKNQARAPLKDPLDEARLLAEEGKYEQALSKHIWLHDHVLEDRPAYYGVRLSYALADWIELGKKYPKALTTLKDIRDKKTSQLLNGDGDRHLFHDVESINDYLGEPKATVDLFKKIESVQPDFAASVYDLADESLIKAEEYALTRKYLGDPTARFSSAKRNFERGIEHAKTSPRGDTSRHAFESIFTDKVLRIMTVLDKTSDHDLARRIQADALAVFESPTIRDAIKN